MNPNVADEMARLSKENEQLRNQLSNSEPKEELINGLSFSDLKELLEADDLLKTLTKYRVLLSLGNGMHTLKIENEDDKLKVTHLCVIGLIVFEERYLSLTQAGFIFLNKLDSEKLKLKKDSETSSDNEANNTP